MYLHLGQEVVVRFSDIVGIFDLEKATLSKTYEGFFGRKPPTNTRVVTVSYEMPKSFIVTMAEQRMYRLYLADFNCNTQKTRRTALTGTFV